MIYEEIKSEVAPCGLDCFNCVVNPKHITDEVRQMLSAKMSLKPEEVECRGCRIEGGCVFHKDCRTLECNRDKKLDFCYQCDDFPCEKLQPASQGAEHYPHNYKLFNLCRIQKVGLEKWAVEEADDIRKRYFQGQFIPGTGPVLEKK